MINVGILFDANFNAITYKYTLFPLVNWHKKLRDYGVNVLFFSNIKSTNQFIKCDCMIVLSSFFGNTLTLKSEQLEILVLLKKQISKVIFFDITDSCGTTKFETLEIIDLYLKRQMYKDKSLYTKNIFSTRTYCDFYLNNFDSVKMDCFDLCLSLQNKHIHKLRIGWNIGIGDYFSKRKIFRNHNSWYCNNHLRIGHKIDNFSFINTNCIPSWFKKDVDINYRGSLKYSIDAISFSRNKINEILDHKASKYIIKYRNKIKHKSFIEELKKSKIIISPFGYGEICFRDFEAFSSNSCLLKPDMSHLETWPDYYQDKKTYIAYKWDFSDAMEIIESILTDNTAQLIAQNGYETFIYKNSNEGAVDFCNQFCGIVK